MLAAIVVLSLVALGCSSDDSDSSGSSSASGSSSSTTARPTTGEPATPPSCPSASTVDDALDADVDDPEDQINGTIRTCTYGTTAGGDEVVIRLETGVDPTDFAAAAQSPGPSGEIPSAVAGLGDAAYSMQRQEPGGTVTEVAALSGTTEVSVLAPVSAASIEGLVRTLLGSL